MKPCSASEGVVMIDSISCGIKGYMSSVVKVQETKRPEERRGRK
jgi:hypothetical protein